MINLALEFITARLNSHLSQVHRVSEELVALAPLVDVGGQPTAETRNRLALFVVNITHDPMPRGTHRPLSAQVATARPLHLDLFFMLASGHDAAIYSEGLKLISTAVNFFQANPVLTARNAPDLPDGFEQVAVEISNLRVEEIGQLWGNLGSRYVPSVMFKMRSVIIDAGAITDVRPLVRSAEGNAIPEEVAQ